MKLLVLGSDGFLGYYIAAEAARLGHTVTTFNRQGESELEHIEALKGDHKGDLSALENRSWDAVIGTFSDPEAIAETAKLLSGSVRAYGFVSGISVYHPDGPAVVTQRGKAGATGEPARRFGRLFRGYP